MEYKERFADLFIGLMSGLAVGAAVGFLYAPRSGKETRALLGEKASELKEKVGEVAEDARMGAGEWRARLRKGQTGNCGPI